MLNAKALAYELELPFELNVFKRILNTAIVLNHNNYKEKQL